MAYQKSHSFASLTRSISDTPQLVCKHRTHALSLEYSIFIPLYYIDESVSLGTKPLVDPYAISSGTRVAYFPYVTFVSVVSFNDIGLSLTWYLNSLVYHRNIFGSSSEVFGHLRKFSEILGKCSGTFVWYSEKFWKIFGNLRKVVGNLRKFIKNAVISMSI